MSLLLTEQAMPSEKQVKRAVLCVESKAAKALPGSLWPRQGPSWAKEQLPGYSGVRGTGTHPPLRGSCCFELAAPLIMNFHQILGCHKENPFWKDRTWAKVCVCVYTWDGWGEGGERWPLSDWTMHMSDVML